MSGAPRIRYGYRLAEDPDEQRVIRTIAYLDERGYTEYEIAQWLNARGVPCRGAERWRFANVQRILDANRT